MSVRILRALAAGLTATADALQHEEPEPIEATNRFVPGEQTRLAQQMGNEIKLRRVLHDALHKFGPAETPAQA